MANILESIGTGLGIVRREVTPPEWIDSAANAGAGEAGRAYDDIFAQGGPVATLGGRAARPHVTDSRISNKKLTDAAATTKYLMQNAGNHQVAPSEQVSLDPALMAKVQQSMDARRAAVAQATGDTAAIGSGPSAAGIRQNMALEGAQRLGAGMGAATRGGNQVLALRGAGAPQAFQGVVQGGQARMNELAGIRDAKTQGTFGNTMSGLGIDRDATGLARTQNQVTLGNAAAAGRDATMGAGVFAEGANQYKAGVGQLVDQANIYQQGAESDAISDSEAKRQYAAYLQNLYRAGNNTVTALGGGEVERKLANAQAVQQQGSAIVNAAGSAVAAGI